MEAQTKIIKAKVQLQRKNPFFSYLVSHLNIQEKKDIDTMGVDVRGNVYYNPTFVEKLDDEELRAVLTHEVLHLVFEHHSRTKKEQLENDDLFMLKNVADDMVINDILVTEGFNLPTLDGGVIIPQNHEYTFMDITVSRLDAKTSDEVYNELYHALDKKGKIKKVKYKGFDEHIKGKKGEEPTREEIDTIKEKWKRAVSEAVTQSRQRGQGTQGINRIADMILNERVNWKQLLYRYITRVIPFDYTYARPSKRSVASGFYMPSILRESIEIVVTIDTSGSIGQEELGTFLAEITSIAKSFHNLKMTLIVCDAEIKDVYHVGNGDAQRISELKIRGGGGTSHIPVYDYLKNNLPNTKLVVNFTDGYTDFPENEEIKTLWVIVGNIEDNRIPFGEVIRL